jgi:hypothetical protein
MGFKPSPYNTAQSYGWAEEVIRGNPADQSLPFHWDRVEMNLPGSAGYNPTRPWVSKRRGDGHMAAVILAYCDNLRVCGFCQKATQASTRQVPQMSNYLGIQDAPRKRRFPARFPGAWAGTIAFTLDDAGVFATISPEKWDKTRAILDDLWDGLENQGGRFLHADVLGDRGFLVYVARTYPAMRPYLKGLHLTIDGWRPGRDDKGWKDAELFRKFPMEVLEIEGSTAPNFVFAVPRLRWDLEALRTLFAASAPAVRTNADIGALWLCGCQRLRLWGLPYVARGNLLPGRRLGQGRG